VAIIGWLLVFCLVCFGATQGFQGTPEEAQRHEERVMMWTIGFIVFVTALVVLFVVFDLPNGM
jgi:hypothetical protein